MDYLMPFLIVLCAGVIVVLVFNLFKIFFASENPRAAYMHIVDGNVEMRTWGTESFFRVTSDTLIMQGDEIRSSAGARLIVEFFDGSIMRVGDNTTVEFLSIVDEGKNPSVNVDLKQGELWFNKLYRDTRGTDITVNLNDIVVHSEMASVFAIENSSSQAVRVFGVFQNEGLLVDILSEDGKKVVETERIGIGQEVIFDDKVLDRYWQFQSPTIISAISDGFKDGRWCKWNLEEDKSPTEFEKPVAGGEAFTFIRVEPEVVDSEMAESNDFDVEFDMEPESDEIEDAEYEIIIDGALEKPKITSVAGITEVDDEGFYRVTSRVATLQGTVSGAAKVIVNDYTLQQFNVGDTTWKYFANADYNLMREGANTYEVYAENSEGKRSEPLIVKVFYKPTHPAPPQEEEKEDEVEEEEEE
jgi:hypothetical protein